MAALSVLVLAWLPSCGGPASAGDFEDGLGSSDALAPDLPRDDCDPRREDQCEAGEKCGYVFDPELGPLNLCVELLGEGQPGDPCETIGDSDDCAAHSLCWGMEAQGQQGVCVEFCSVSLGCDDPLMTCAVSNANQLPLCLPVCEPLAQDCDEGWGCYPDDYQRWACDRDQSGASGSYGDPCACLNCCDPGLICLSGALVDVEGCGSEGAAGCCAEICDLDGQPPEGTTCPGEFESCEPYYEPDAVLMGYEDVGICQL